MRIQPDGHGTVGNVTFDSVDGLLVPVVVVIDLSLLIRDGVLYVRGMFAPLLQPVYWAVYPAISTAIAPCCDDADDYNPAAVVTR